MNNNEVENDLTTLQNKLQQLKGSYTLRLKISRAALLIGLVMLFLAPILYFGFQMRFPGMFVFLYSFVFLVYPVLRPSSEIQLAIRDTENEIDLRRVAVSQIEKRAEKLFRAHQFELKKYYDQTLRQSAWIFIVGLFCLAAGFAVIGFVLYTVLYQSAGMAVSEQIIVGALGVVGGVMADFIAIMYLKMYGETTSSLTEFHNRLVKTHHLHFGNFLVSKITDTQLRESSLSEISGLLVENL